MTEQTPPSPAAAPPTGWYPDPGGGWGWRFWSGTAWTTTIENPPDRRSELNGVVRREERSAATLLNWLLVANCATVLVSLWSAMLDLSFKVATAEWVHQVIHVALSTPSGTAPLFPPAPTSTTTGLVAALHVIAVIGQGISVTTVVVVLVFQHRAATAAQFFGYPARFRPSAGVWMWFVPLGNLYLPYRALADCFAPDDRHRKLVWTTAALAWCGLAAAVLTVVSFVHPTRLLCGAGSVCVAGATCAWLLSMHRVVAAIRVDHDSFATSATA